MPNVGPNEQRVAAVQAQLAERGAGRDVVRIEREAEKGLLARRAIGVAVVARADLPERGPARTHVHIALTRSNRGIAG